MRRAARKAAANGAAEDQGSKASRFRALALPYLDDVYTLARYLLPRADAEDAVQECYLRAYRYFDSFGGTAIKPWLFAILRNVCRSQRARNGSLVFGEPEDVDDAAEKFPPLWSETAETPESALIRRDNAVTLHRLIENLPGEFREVLVLRELSDLSYREIAQVTGGPVGTVMSRLARAQNAARGLDRYGGQDMNCEEARKLVHPLIDGELDAYHTGEVEAHAESCAGCAAELASLRGLQTQIASAQLRYHAPESLRRQIDRVLPQREMRPSRREWLKGFGVGAGLSAIAASAAFIMVIRNDADSRILSDVVSAHLRSLEPDHLTDVLSTDRHTVKPWFNGRLDVAPPVVDLTAQGFTLVGGRLDAIGGKMVAVIVYRRRAHIINLFAAAGPAKRRSAVTELVNGFNIRHWSDEGVSLWAISDINAGELEEFSDKFKAAIQKGP